MVYGVSVDVKKVADYSKGTRRRLSFVGFYEGIIPGQPIFQGRWMRDRGCPIVCHSVLSGHAFVAGDGNVHPETRLMFTQYYTTGQTYYERPGGFHAPHITGQEIKYKDLGEVIHLLARNTKDPRDPAHTLPHAAFAARLHTPRAAAWSSQVPITIYRVLSLEEVEGGNTIAKKISQCWGLSDAS